MFSKKRRMMNKGGRFIICVYRYIYIFISYKYVFLPVNGCIIFGAHLVKTPN